MTQEISVGNIEYTICNKKWANGAKAIRPNEITRGKKREIGPTATL